MKKLLTYFWLLLLIGFYPVELIGQNMNSGFRLLESGDYAGASVYFKNILKKNPTNKTALICYGRAIGLSGNAQMALTIFAELNTKYPSDQEVLLNKAEAYLWLKMPENALTIYRQVLEQDSLSFNALLGTANSFSMSKQYEFANNWVRRALTVNSSSKQALLSQKFIRLGFANKLAAEQQRFDEALKLVALNLSENPDDQESLKLKANIHIMAGDFVQATQAFGKMENQVDRLLGLSLAKHMEKKDVDALTYAKEALREDEIRTKIHYISALLWNNKLRTARAFADSLVASNPSTFEYVASQAQVAMYEADFIEGYEAYSSFLDLNPDSFKGNLGLADASHALGIDDQAYKYANQTLKYYPGQRDAKNFIQKLNSSHSPFFSGSFTYGKSSDGSSYAGWAAGLESSVSPRVSISTQHALRTYHTGQNNSVSRTQTLSIGATGQLGKRMKAMAKVSKINLFQDEVKSSSRITTEATLSARLSKVQTASLGHKSELQDFNSDLLNQNLKTNHLMAKNIMSWKKSGLGLYSEYYHSFYSDGNSRQLLFNSFYKSIEKKEVKFGVNHLTMAFDQSRPSKYFSPTSFHQFEVFGDATIRHQSVPVRLKLNSAFGYQLTSSQNQFSWRMRASLEKTSGRLQLNIFAAYSTIGTVQANGFSFFNCGANIKWQITKTPLFNIQ